MQLTPAILDAVFYKFRMDYQSAYDEAPAWWDKIATKIPSTTRENRYAWMKKMPRMREWLGERILNNVSALGSVIVNKDWEATVAIDRNDLKDDQVGLYSGLMREMGAQTKRWPDDMVAAALLGGLAQLAFDGQPFFNDSHPVDAANTGLGSYSNNFVLTELNFDNFQLVRQAMRLFKGEDGRPMNITPNLLIVPPQLELKAMQLMKGTIIAPTLGLGLNAAQPQSNVLTGAAEILVIPELGDYPTTWYLADTTRPIKPFVFQEREAPSVTVLTDPQAENVFFQKKFIYGVDARGAAGFTLPFLIARATAEAA